MSFQTSAQRPSYSLATAPDGYRPPESAFQSESAGPGVACFHVVADAHPGLLGRLLGVIAKRGIVPSYVHSVLGGRKGDELAVDLQVPSLDEGARDLVSAQLRAVVSVRAVLTSVKSFAD